MPFQQSFERNVNENMQEGEAGRAPAHLEAEDADIKKHHDAGKSSLEEQDHEMFEKKDSPPRFSTLFGGNSPPVVLENYPPPKRRSGVTISMPLFIVFALILLVESTFLFAYTIVGLYINRPAGLFAVGGSLAPIDGCNCASQQPAVNIAPNFFVGKDAIVSADNALGVIKATSSSLTTSTDTASVSTKTGRVKIVTYTPPPATIITSTKLSTTVIPVSSSADDEGEGKTVYATVNEDGSTLPTTVPTSTADQAAKRASISEAVASLNAVLTPDVTPPASTLKREASPKPTADAPSPSQDDDEGPEPPNTSDGVMPCFGAGGAVMQVCP